MLSSGSDWHAGDACTPTPTEAEGEQLMTRGLDADVQVHQLKIDRALSKPAREIVRLVERLRQFC